MTESITAVAGTLTSATILCASNAWTGTGFLPAAAAVPAGLRHRDRDPVS